MAPRKYPSIPRVLVLPGGFKIKTILVDPKSMAKEGLKDAYAAWIVDTGLPGGTIFIDNSYPFNTRWDSYIHEIHHAITDWDHYIRDKVITPFLIEVGEDIENEDPDPD